MAVSLKSKYSPVTKYVTLIASFFIMLCLGGIYAWSIIAAELMITFNFSSSQTQIVFGTVIAVFPTTMILAGKFEKRLGARLIAILSAVFVCFGYLLSAYSNGNFLIILIGIGIFTGIGTGFGYLIALSAPVKWFPRKKGLITGIAAAGFGLAAIVLSFIIEVLLRSGRNILDVFIIIGIAYGSVILVFANFISQPAAKLPVKNIPVISYLKTPDFLRLLSGIFFGTFAGLLIIGSLKHIGAKHFISNHTLILGISVFAIANFSGRIVWGFISDYTGASISVFLALTFQAIAIFLLGYLPLENASYIFLSACIGFGFGSNFVLFAKETAQVYGLDNFGFVYPYVFMGYAIAGILGPLTGGALYDHFNNYTIAITVASIMSLSGAALFLTDHFRKPGQGTAEKIDAAS